MTSSHLSYTDDLGRTFGTGNVPSPPMFQASLPAYADLYADSMLSEADVKTWLGTVGGQWLDKPATIKRKDQNGYGACFKSGTRVRMEDGTERPIEAVRVLDRVLTAEGRIGRVLKTMVRDETDGVVRVSLWGHTHLEATAEHPFLTERGYIPAGDLKLGDWVAMPRYAPASRQVIQTEEHLPARGMITRAGKGRRNFNAPEGRTKVSVVLTPIPDLIDLTPGVGRIFGLFLAEGRTDQGKVTWTFNKAEENTLVADLVKLLRDEWGVEAHLQFRPNNSINVVVYGTPWAKLFESLCANGSGAKRLHADLTSGPLEFLGSLLDGWLDGDGHARRNEVRGTTISRDLAIGMFDIAQALGRRPSIRRYVSRDYGTAKERQPRWEVSTGSSEQDTYRCRMDDTHVWRRVKGIERHEFVGPVFNLEVEGDNSYVAEGIGVHNCDGHAAATSIEGARYIANMAPVDISAWDIYARMCGGIDRGASIGETLPEVMKNGAAPESLVPYGIINPNRIPATAVAARPQYRVEIGANITTYEELLTAYVRLQPLNLAVCASGSFTTLDSEGIPLSFRRGGYCNHAQAGMLGLKWSTYYNCLCGFVFNSWGTSVQDDGCYWAPLKIVPQFGAFEAYNVRAVVDALTDITRPPVLLA